MKDPLMNPGKNIFASICKGGERHPCDLWNISWKLLIKMANMDILIFGCLAEFQILHHHEAMHVLLSGVEVWSNDRNEAASLKLKDSSKSNDCISLKVFFEFWFILWLFLFYLAFSLLVVLVKFTSIFRCWLVGSSWLIMVEYKQKYKYKIQIQTQNTNTNTKITQRS